MDEDMLWLEDISHEDKDLVGEKAANLAELYNLKIPVPRAFVITTQLYQTSYSEIKAKVQAQLNTIVDEASLKSAAARIKQLFLSLNFPEGLKLDISDSYKKLDLSFEDIPKHFEFINAGRDPLFITVRSSSTHHVPNQQSSYLGLKGISDLLTAIKHCWASLFTPRAIVYRKKNNLPEPEIAVIIQKMVNSTRSGTIFTTDPESADSNKILLEAEYGFSKKSNPSKYVFDKESNMLISNTLRSQNFYYSRDGGGKITRQPMPMNTTSINPLPEDDAKSLVNMAKKVEEYFGQPQVIEWSAESRKLFLLQSHDQDLIEPLMSEGIPSENMVSRGLPVFRSQGSGTVSIVNSKESADAFQEDNILITDMTNPYLFFVADKAKAIITSGGGFASHATQICKELDKPCIIGAENATRILQNGDKISFDEHGFIYREPQPQEQPITIPDLSTLGNTSPCEPEATTRAAPDLGDIMQETVEIEQQITELVYQDAERRRHGDIDDRAYSELLSDIEWDIRDIRKKLQHFLEKKES